jgi:hypothetical protein
MRKLQQSRGFFNRALKTTADVGTIAVGGYFAASSEEVTEGRNYAVPKLSITSN